LEEGRELIDKDPVQASEKLYKVADEALKALAYHFDLQDVLKKVGGRGLVGGEGGPSRSSRRLS
jgi:hypothetical protein